MLGIWIKDGEEGSVMRADGGLEVESWGRRTVEEGKLRSE